MITLGADTLTVEKQIQLEWLDTNGLGGWASSTINGCNTRRYHGLLVAATRPPTERMVLISKIDETIIVNDERVQLGTNDYGDVLHPNGYQFLKTFEKDLYPVFRYAVNDIELQKSILMVNGENTTIIKYEVLNGRSFTMELLPLLAARGYHQLGHRNDAVCKQDQVDDHFIRLKLFETTPDIFIGFNRGNYHVNPDWYFHFNYCVEQYRGLDFTEDLFTPGILSVALKEGDVLYVVLSTHQTSIDHAEQQFEAEVKRRRQMVDNENSHLLKQLILAADQFIVRRSDDLKTIIAGYHWFTDWGRDTMIALPGLCLATGRLEDAKKILYAFAQSVDQGMLPNRFPDNEEAPEYNNVDGTLQYFIAIHHYLQATGDLDFILTELLPVLKDIIDHHYRGTRYNIHVDHDGLLFAGENGYQLTWMDARIGDWVVTPRMGKAVEIQALWYNALCIFAELLRLNDEVDAANKMAKQAGIVKENFLKLFWFGPGGYLLDVIDENGIADPSLRPNQLFAISLPYPLIEGEKAMKVMNIVHEKLYTPRGLRSLSPHDERYVPVYSGNQLKRDSSYHQGTVWSWLLGPYVDCLFKTCDPSAALVRAKKLIHDLMPHLSEAGIGTISEIFDGEAPHTSRGCIAQAWSVGEILRVVKTYNLTAQKQH